MSRSPVHFLEIDGAGSGRLCRDGGRRRPTTLLVQRITCKDCLDALNRRLARARLRAERARRANAGGRRSGTDPTGGA